MQINLRPEIASERARCGRRWAQRPPTLPVPSLVSCARVNSERHVSGSGPHVTRTTRRAGRHRPNPNGSHPRPIHGAAHPPHHATIPPGKDKIQFTIPTPAII